MECLCFMFMMFECLNLYEKRKYEDEIIGRVWVIISGRSVVDGDSSVDRIYLF